MDNIFVSKVSKIVLDNLPNEKFGVREVAKSLGLSRSQVLRRVKSATGKSVNQLIREIRLQEALKLLQEEKSTIAEIAYEVGFSSPSYFSKCFYDHFRCTPSDFKNVNPTFNNKQKASKKPVFYIVYAVVTIFIVALLLIWAISPFSKNDQKRIVVLPISNYSYDANLDYLGDSFTDAITLELAKSKQLEVVSRTTAMLYKKSNKDLRGIAKTLDVDLILEASFSVENDSIHVIVQLIKPLPKEAHVWQQNYYQSFNNIIQLTRTISEDIALKIDRSIHSPTGNHHAIVNQKAYELFLRGQYLYNQQNTASLRASLNYLQESILIDPSFAPVYVTLGDAYILLNKLIPNNIDRLDHRNKCREAINKALELDPDLASAYIAKGNILGKFDWNWEEMKQFAEKGLSIEPNNAQGHIILSNYYLINGQPKLVQKEINKALALDPLNKRIGYLVGERLILLGKYNAAIQQFEKVLELDPNYGLALDGLGYVYFILGDKTKAIEVWQRLHIAMGNNEFAEYLGKNTFEKSMRFMLEKTKNDNPLYCSNPTILAIATSLIEDKEQTLNYLDIAFKYRHEDLPLGLLKPHFLSYHSNERFKTIAQNMGVHIGSNLGND
jgi:AraC-like DNA-binding protein/TolB-like protein